MLEKQSIKGKNVWIKIDPFHVERDNPNIIPTEYFTAVYYFQEPSTGTTGKTINDEDDSPKLFESPVAALSHAAKKIEASL